MIYITNSDSSHQTQHHDQHSAFLINIMIKISNAAFWSDVTFWSAIECISISLYNSCYVYNDHNQSSILSLVCMLAS